MICLFINTHAICVCCFYYIMSTSCFPLSSTLWKSLQQSGQGSSLFFICCLHSIACIWHLFNQSLMIAFHSVLRFFFCLYSAAKNILVHMSLQELLPLNCFQNMPQLTYFGRKNKMSCDFLIKFYLINQPENRLGFHYLIFNFSYFGISQYVPPILKERYGTRSTALLKTQPSRSLSTII